MMNLTISASNKRATLEKLAQAGLITKGVVYCLLGIFAFMAAFHLGSSSVQDTDKQGVIRWVRDLTGGSVLLVVLILGMLCYSLWRFIQAIANTDHKSKDAKGWVQRARYLFSGLLYLSLSLTTLRLFIGRSSGSSQNSNEQMASSVLQAPVGQWLLGLFALGLVATGIYQIWYGYSEKYRKHVQKMNHQDATARLLLRAGKAGYIARGVVWLTIAWLLLKAAFYARAEEAANTSEAFQFLESTEYGNFIIAAVGAGLVGYGIFNFIRAKYERLV